MAPNALKAQWKPAQGKRSAALGRDCGVLVPCKGTGYTSVPPNALSQRPCRARSRYAFEPRATLRFALGWLATALSGHFEAALRENPPHSKAIDENVADD
jgi:hypothetical protein